MILDLPLGAHVGVAEAVSGAIGLHPIMYYGRGREVRARDLDRRVLRVTNLRLRPFDDRYRVFQHNIKTGRRSRTANVCWHGHRDWMRGVLAAYPEAVIRSGMEVYDGIADFNERHESTQAEYQNLHCLCEEK